MQESKDNVVEMECLPYWRPFNVQRSFLRFISKNLALLIMVLIRCESFILSTPLSKTIFNKDGIHSGIIYIRRTSNDIEID